MGYFDIVLEADTGGSEQPTVEVQPAQCEQHSGFINQAIFVVRTSAGCFLQPIIYRSSFSPDYQAEEIIALN